jgi:hypothetical protein
VIDAGLRRIRPAVQVGRGINVTTNLRNSAASGQLEANAGRTRLAVSLIRTAIFRNRSRIVENLPLASFLHCFQRKTPATAMGNLGVAESRYRDLVKALTP